MSLALREKIVNSIEAAAASSLTITWVGKVAVIATAGAATALAAKAPPDGHTLLLATVVAGVAACSDDAVQPDTNTTPADLSLRGLRVSTGPDTVFEIGSRVWLEIDPAAMVRVE